MYYEGILQLRNPSKDVFKFLNELIRERKRIKIVKEEKTKNGVDLYTDNQRYMIAIGRKLQKRFGGEFKITRKLHTADRISGKRIYRVSVLFRLPDFKIGDIIKYRGKQIKVKAIGNKVSGMDMESGKRISIPYKDIKT
jgi:nonsense-mediated mRNA decay protein 3